MTTAFFRGRGPVSTNDLLQRLLQGPLRNLEPIEQELFRLRFELCLNDALRPLGKLYGERKDYESVVARFAEIVAHAYARRPADLRLLDLRREAQPDWFQHSTMIGYVCYADRFAGSLDGVAEKIPYLRELGVTYLHLMPLLKPRPGSNDGGYAVMSYRQVNPDLGTMDDLAALAARLRDEGISLCIDLVCNHTAKEHRWAQRAMDGDAAYQDYYLMFADRTLPDRYEQTLPEVFPDFKPGNFTYYEEIERWVWTTFHEYQWDLNYANPAVFAEMLDIILFLANQGVEVLRMDAVAFMWKRMGTDCQNQPEAHYLLQAFRALSRIAAPALLLKAEAIVAPERLIHYLGRGLAANKECELAYHNQLMVLMWSALAERRAVLMTHALQQMPETPSGCSWVTYARCHDDIGWAISDEDAAGVGLSGAMHRAFLSDFYSGRFPGSFARGATFQFNPRTGDRRINGSMASLAGLEVAQESQDGQQIEFAVRRILLLHNLLFAFGGIPLIYMGDELGLPNDYSYLNDANLAGDNRWIHRPRMDWNRAADRRANRQDGQSVAAQIFQAILSLVAARKATPALHAQAGSHAIWTGNDHVFGLLRDSPRGRVLVLANVSEEVRAVSGQRLQELGFDSYLVDLISGKLVESWPELALEPYEAFWLGRQSRTNEGRLAFFD